MGLSAVIAAKDLGAQKIIAMSRRKTWHKLTAWFGATDTTTSLLLGASWPIRAGARWRSCGVTYR